MEHAPVLIVIMLIFGFANVFFGRDIFRPLLLAYGFIAGILLVGGIAEATNTEASALAVVGVGGMFALLSFIVYYLGLALIGGGAGALVLMFIASLFGTEPSSVLLFIIVVICAVVALIFHDYVLILATAAAGASMVAQAIYLFFPDTRAAFSFERGLVFLNVSTPALVIGALITLILTGLGVYMQFKSYQEHQHQGY